MNIKIFFFSPLDQLTGTKHLIMTIEEPTTLELLFKKLIDQYPELKKLYSNINPKELFSFHMTVIKNDQIAKYDMRIEDGDTVNFFSPLDGG